MLSRLSFILCDLTFKFDVGAPAQERTVFAPQGPQERSRHSHVTSASDSSWSAWTYQASISARIEEAEYEKFTQICILLI